VATTSHSAASAAGEGDHTAPAASSAFARFAPEIVNNNCMAGGEQLPGNRRADLTDADKPDVHKRGSPGKEGVIASGAKRSRRDCRGACGGSQ
jgi:hypothetical protein